jgi:hypothetical protein
VTGGAAEFQPSDRERTGSLSDAALGNSSDGALL